MQLADGLLLSETYNRENLLTPEVYVAEIEHNLEALYCLAQCYRFGQGVGKDLSQYHLLLKKAAENGYVAAQVELGVSYAYGLEPMKEDDHEAFSWMKRAANSGSLVAKYNLGILYKTGTGVTQDICYASQLFYEVCGSNGPLGFYFFNAENELINIWSNYPEDIVNKIFTIAFVQKLAESGSRFFMGLLGLLLNRRKSEDALSWLEKGADDRLRLDNAPPKDLSVDAKLVMRRLCQLTLGNIYYYGKGVPQNRKDGMHWFLLAAQNGALEAVTMVGIEHYLGTVLRKDYAKAFSYLDYAYKHNDLRAQFVLADLYRLGRGVDKNEVKAFKLLNDCAKQVFSGSYKWLGYYYQCGIGTQKDSQKAVFWYEKSAANGDEEASIRLGLLYLFGNGNVLSDQPKAFQWFEHSKDNGFIGVCKIFGIGTSKNVEEGISLLHNAGPDSIPALVALSYCYQHGLGVKRNASLQLKYLGQALEKDGALAEKYNRIITTLASQETLTALEKISCLESELQKANVRLALLNTHLEKARETNHGLEKEIDGYKKEQEVLTEKKKKATKIAAKLNAEKNAAIEQIEKLQTSLSEERKKLAIKDQEIAQLSEEVSEKENAFNNTVYNMDSITLRTIVLYEP